MSEIDRLQAVDFFFWVWIADTMVSAMVTAINPSEKLAVVG
jgi:hypothetical protein